MLPSLPIPCFHATMLRRQNRSQPPTWTPTQTKTMPKENVNMRHLVVFATRKTPNGLLSSSRIPIHAALTAVGLRWPWMLPWLCLMLQSQNLLSTPYCLFSGTMHKHSSALWEQLWDLKMVFRKVVCQLWDFRGPCFVVSAYDQAMLSRHVWV